MHKELWMLNAHQLRSQGYKQFQIAEALGVTDRTVRNYLKDQPRPRKIPTRNSLLESYKPFINGILENNPHYNCIILQRRLLRQGYSGSISILRDYAAKVKNKLLMEAVIRFETEPGFQAQVDWKEFRRTRPDGKKEKVYAFKMVMGYSRYPFVMFTKSMKQCILLACHIEAFAHFGGVPQEILYDNMKTAFVCDPEGIWRPNKALLGFAHYYGFIPKRCRIRRPQTKGKVERAIGYLNNNFWPEVENEIWDIDGLNDAVKIWMNQISQNELREFRQTRAQRFELEKELLISLPPKDYDYREEHGLIVNRESCITFQTNRYSVPPEFIGQTLKVKVDPVTQTVELYSCGASIRQFKLEEAGGRKKIMTPEDQAAIKKLWLKQQEHRLKNQKPRRSSQKQQTEIEVRSPAVYEQLVVSEEVA